MCLPPSPHEPRRGPCATTSSWGAEGSGGGGDVGGGKRGGERVRLGEYGRRARRLQSGWLGARGQKGQSLRRCPAPPCGRCEVDSAPRRVTLRGVAAGRVVWRCAGRAPPIGPRRRGQPLAATSVGNGDSARSTGRRGPAAWGQRRASWGWGGGGGLLVGRPPQAARLWSHTAAEYRSDAVESRWERPVGVVGLRGPGGSRLGVWIRTV